MKNYKQKAECLLAWLSERKVTKPKKNQNAPTEIFNPKTKIR